MNTEHAYENAKPFGENIAKYCAERLYLSSLANAMLGKYGFVFRIHLFDRYMHCLNETMNKKAAVKNQNNNRTSMKCNLFSLWETNIGSSPVYLLKYVIIAGWFMYWNLSTPHYSPV